MKPFLTSLLFAGSLLSPVYAYGQDAQETSNNIEDAELELAKAKLAVAKAEAELAEAKLKAIKLKDIEKTEIPERDEPGAEKSPNPDETDDDNKKTIETGVDTVLDLATTTQAIAAIQPKAIAAEAVKDTVADVGTDLAKKGVKDIGSTLADEAGNAIEGAAKGILSVPGRLVGGQGKEEAGADLENNKIQSVDIGTEIEIEPEIRLDTRNDRLSESTIEPDVSIIQNLETNVDATIPEVVSVPANVIMPGLLDLPRHEYTGPLDGCTSTKKGLVMGGGFMLFTCEKLLPFYEISDHSVTYEAYQNIFEEEGWKETPSEEPAKNKVSFKRKDSFGCDVIVDMELWTDRSMNESNLNLGDRNSHRQIVFKAWFRGDICDIHYETAESLTD